MAKVIRLGSLRELNAALRREVRGVGKRAQRAAAKAADVGRLAVYGNAPVAFGDVRESLSAETTREGGRIVADAPHAAAVEVGSRPHMPPIAPLVAWVKLRGMQGLNAAASGGSPRGQPGLVAEQIRARGTSTSTPVGAPEDIAWQIARAIAKNGTRPTWFMRSSLAEIRQILDAYMKSFVKQGL